MVSQTAEKIEYDSMGATIMSIIINEINNQDTVKRKQFMERFSLKEGKINFVNKYTKLHMVKCYISVKDHDLNQSK